MAYVPINASEITTGEPVTNTTQTKIKDNANNHETRILSLEGGGNTIYPPIILRVNGTYNGCVYESILKTTLNFNLVITGIRLLIDTAGTSGTTEVNLKYKRGAGSWVNILTTNPSVIYSAGNDALSTNAVLNTSNVNLQAGDIVRLDMISAQSGARGFLVRIDFNKT
jgi:hypothetical protein